MSQTEKAILKISQSKEKLEKVMIDALENCPEISSELTEKDLANIAGGKSNFNKKLISTALSALTILPTAAPLAGAAEPANGSSAESSVTSKKEVDKKKKPSIWSRLLELADIPVALGIVALGYCKLRNIDDRTHGRTDSSETNTDIKEQIFTQTTLKNSSSYKATFQNYLPSYVLCLYSASIRALRTEALQSLLPKFNTTFLENLLDVIFEACPNKFGSDREFFSDVYKQEKNLQEQQAFTDKIASQLAPGQNKLVLKYLLSLFCELFAACSHDLPSIDYCEQQNIRSMLEYSGDSFRKRFTQQIEKLHRATGLPIKNINIHLFNPYTIIIALLNTAVNELK